MKRGKSVKTKHGLFSQDYCGLWHYQCTKKNVTALTATKDAVMHRPKGAVWFWFDGTPAPLVPGDKQKKLHTRWEVWNYKIKNDGEGFLQRVEQYRDDSMNDEPRL